jgi:hypothetical protein
MKKVIRLTESDLARIVKRVIKEQVFDQAAMDAKVAATNAIVSKYITSALKLDLKGGGPISVKNVTIYSRANMSTGGITVSVAFNIKESGVDYSIDFPIYGNGPKANYMGTKDETSAKTYFDTSFPKSVGKYFATTGTNYDTCKQGIWNGIVAVTNVYNTAGVAIK